jgi:hypothetical protein
MSCWEPSNKGAIFGPMAAPVRADALRRRTMSIHSYTLIRLPFAGADAARSPRRRERATSVARRDQVPLASADHRIP